MRIRNYRDADFEAIVKIDHLAFAPIHKSFRGILGRRIFDSVYPNWKKSHRKYIASLCKGKDRRNLLVAEEDNEVIGFISYFIHRKEKSGELGLNAVLPSHQNRGIGTKMYKEVLKKLKAQGVDVVYVGTGGDDSHLPARRAYEKCGFVALPLVRYYISL